MSEEKLFAGSVIFRKKDGKTSWFIVKAQETDQWEIPKGQVRRGESSVRAAMRTVEEQANLQTRVLEEAGRASFSGSSVIYYLMQQNSTFPGKPNYNQVSWLSQTLAKQKLGKASEKRILSLANQALREWLKKNG